MSILEIVDGSIFEMLPYLTLISYKQSDISKNISQLVQIFVDNLMYPQVNAGNVYRKNMETKITCMCLL